MTNISSEKKNKLFLPEGIFISENVTRDSIFTEVAQQLVELGLVKENFLDNLIERENNFPTGLDLSVVHSSLPNIAIPHTEGEFVNTRCVIPVKLMTPVPFNNMISPSKSLDASFLFIILNNDPESQTNILSDIMGFLSTTDSEELNKFFDYTKKEDIYNFLQKNFY